MTVYESGPVNTKGHPSESPDRRETIPVKNDDSPSNYFYEQPVNHHAPISEHHTLVMTDQESMAHAL